MSLIRLADWPDSMIYTGMRLRFPAILPYEDWVEFMLVVIPDQENALLVDTGYKAGRIPQVLPPDAGPTGAVSCKWLMENWTKWVFPSTPPEQVWIVPAADPPSAAQ